jgi:hypothetical protein
MATQRTVRKRAEAALSGVTFIFVCCEVMLGSKLLSLN